MTTQPVTAFGYTPSIDQLLVADTANPDVITRYMPLTAAGTKPTHQYTANKVPVTDITPGAGCSWVVCAGGSATLYVLPDGGSLLGGNSDNSLRDPFTQASIPVNRVRAVAGAALTYRHQGEYPHDPGAGGRLHRLRPLRHRPGPWRGLALYHGPQRALGPGDDRRGYRRGANRAHPPAAAGSHPSASRRYRSPTRGACTTSACLRRNLDLGPSCSDWARSAARRLSSANDVGALGNMGIAGGIGGAGGSAPPPETDTGGSGRGRRHPGVARRVRAAAGRLALGAPAGQAPELQLPVC